jgi:hypothetical protein
MDIIFLYSRYAGTAPVIICDFCESYIPATTTAKIDPTAEAIEVPRTTEWSILPFLLFIYKKVIANEIIPTMAYFNIGCHNSHINFFLVKDENYFY